MVERHTNVRYAIMLLTMTMIVAGAAVPVRAAPGAGISVRDHGAVGDGAAKDTAAVQRTIDACAANGGGTVLFSAGTYLCGSLHLKSNVTLHLDNGATILGSTLGTWITAVFVPPRSRFSSTARFRLRFSRKGKG